MVQWKKLAVGLIMACAANPAFVTGVADDKPAAESKEDETKKDDEESDADPATPGAPKKAGDL